MANYDFKCRMVNEELSSFWPEWNVVRWIGGGTFGDVFHICRDNMGLRIDAALKVTQVPDEESTLPLLIQQLSNAETNGGISSDEKSSDERFHKAGRSNTEAHIYKNFTLPKAVYNEIRIMELLRGAPNIVSIEDFHYYDLSSIGTGAYGGNSARLYVRMELLTSLQDLLSGKQGLPDVIRKRMDYDSATDAFLDNYKESPHLEILSVAEICKIASDICMALDYCEQNNIIHRDIKPANIFIDRFGNYKIGDFGVSRSVNSLSTAHTMTGIGTISYMAPEIYRMKAYDHTVDIYALGLVLYQLLNRGRAPFLPDYPKAFTTADVDSANYRRLNGHTIERLKGIDDELDRIVRKACAYNARERYQSAEEMKSDIDNYLWKSSIQKKAQDASLSGHSIKFDSEDSSHYTADSKNRKANKTEGSVFEYADSGKSKETVNTDVYTKDKYLEKSSIRKKRQLFLVTGIFLLLIIVLLSVLLMNYLHLKEKENNDRVSSESEDTEYYGTYSNPDAHFSMHYYYEEGRDDIGHWYVYNYDTDKRIRLSDLADYNDVYNDAIENRSSAEFWKLIAFLLGILLLSCLAFQFIRKAYNEKHGAINRV